VKRPPLPKSGPHIAEVEFRTPYEQVVLRARQAPGSYSAQQAEEDYRAQPDLVLVRVRINLTPTYPAYVIDRSSGSDRKTSGAISQSASRRVSGGPHPKT